LSLDSNGAYCCTATGIRPEVLLKFRGTTQQSHQSVYVIDFRSGSSLGGAFGTIYVSMRSYLPVSYTMATRPVQTFGTFTVTYGGGFTIEAPHS